jgi:hypothetical protein
MDGNNFSLFMLLVDPFISSGRWIYTKIMNGEGLVKMTCPSTLENGHVPQINLKN